MNWWISSAERSVSGEVPASPHEVRAFYVDLHNIPLVHPLVVSVTTIGREPASDGYVQTYRVRDRIPLGPITLHTRYVARLTVPTQGDVIAEARQFPRVRLNTVVTFEPVADGTRVTERMRIDAPRLLARVTVREAVKAHAAMLENLRAHFSSPADRQS